MEEKTEFRKEDFTVTVKELEAAQRISSGSVSRYSREGAFPFSLISPKRKIFHSSCLNMSHGETVRNREAGKYKEPLLILYKKKEVRTPSLSLETLAKRVEALEKMLYIKKPAPILNMDHMDQSVLL